MDKCVPQIGDRFGRWTVCGPGRRSGNQIEVRCDCGSEASRPAHLLLSGKSTHCPACAEATRNAPLQVALRQLKRLDQTELQQLRQAITTTLNEND